MPELAPLAGRVGTALFQLGWWVASKIWPNVSSPSVSQLSAAIQTTWEGVKVLATSIVRVRDLDVTWGGIIGNNINDVGGAVEAIGQDQHRLWHHLRYIMMPNTIQLIWNWVWWSWVRPLRSHLGYVASWAWQWHIYTRAYMWQLKNWAHAIIGYQRAHRAKYVYPQLRWLMSPQRVAFYYAQSFLTEIAQYLAYPGHVHDRDAVARAVIDTSPRLWRHLEQAALAFLQQPIDGTGYGSALPQRPSWATQGPPDVPPIWEPWVTTPSLAPWPIDSPKIPELDPKYDGGILGIN